MKNSFTLPTIEYRRLYRRAYRAQQNGYYEICGLMIVDRNRSIRLEFLKNQSKRPGQFSIDLNEARFVVRQAKQSSSTRVLGSFHSHPVGEAIPGASDLANGFYYGVEMIFDVCACEARLWRRMKRSKKLTAEPLDLIVKKSVYPRSQVVRQGRRIK